MKIYNGLGKENLDFEEAMELIKKEVNKLDEYILEILFDILMEEEVKNELYN